MTCLSPQRTFIMLLLFSTISVFLWAANAEVEVIVRTVGQIIPAGKSQIVQHLEGGIIEKILVQEGQVVAAGQPLMELADVQNRSYLEQERSRLDAWRGREIRLLAELNGDQTIAFPKEFKATDVIRAETAAWQARQAQLAEEVQVLQSLSVQKKNELAEITSKQKNLLEELVLAKKKNHVIEGLRKNNAASELEVLDSEMRIQQLKSQIAEATSTAPRLQAAQAEAESRVKEAIARFRAEASAELTEVGEELEKLSLGIGTSVDRLKRNTVRSPVAGLINKLNITTIGAVVRPSEILLEITPSDQRIVIETRSNPDDRAHLRRGLLARVRVGAYDYATYGTFEGHVTDVSSDTLTDERGSRYYRVNVEVDLSTLTSRVRQPGVLMPGMAASADIAVGKRTILSYILSPLLEFRDGAFRAN
ncbi:MAG: HlyD family type I secretion periplasmic adaptor subunit [Proteobacteria bacterium]|nr:HlyD family type I secretion periplasmic adaptor subunit [Pseudomonadota bacterium]MBU1717005.1 HlyD family type I secretion periplasmic adaptor subunit [Pseudomonadota bacterium]